MGVSGYGGRGSHDTAARTILERGSMERRQERAGVLYASMRCRCCLSALVQTNAQCCCQQRLLVLPSTAAHTAQGLKCATPAAAQRNPDLVRQFTCSTHPVLGASAFVPRYRFRCSAVAASSRQTTELTANEQLQQAASSRSKQPQAAVTVSSTASTQQQQEAVRGSSTMSSSPQQSLFAVASKRAGYVCHRNEATTHNSATKRRTINQFTQNSSFPRPAT